MEIREITQAEIKSGKLDESKMSPAELAWRQAKLAAKKPAKKRVRR